MLPFVIGGGIMIALAFLIDTICGYGSTGGSNFGTCTPLSAFFKYVGDLSMGLMVPVLAGYIAYSIADRPGLAVGFTGGLLASSGNAAIAKYIWAGASLSPFQNFISKFGFVGEGSGNTVSGFLGGILAGFLAVVSGSCCRFRWRRYRSSSMVLYIRFVHHSAIRICKNHSDPVYGCISGKKL